MLGVGQPVVEGGVAGTDHVQECRRAAVVEEGRAKLEEHYRSKGYPKTTIAILDGDKPRDKGVVYMVTEGFQEKIWSVDFVGNTID